MSRPVDPKRAARLAVWEALGLADDVVERHEPREGWVIVYPVPVREPAGVTRHGPAMVTPRALVVQHHRASSLRPGNEVVLVRDGVYGAPLDSTGLPGCQVVRESSLGCLVQPAQQVPDAAHLASNRTPGTPLELEPTMAAVPEDREQDRARENARVILDKAPADPRMAEERARQKAGEAMAAVLRKRGATPDDVERALRELDTFPLRPADHPHKGVGPPS